MEQQIKQRLRRTTITFWLLLLYVIAALVWWFISLEKQNKEMYTYQRNHPQIAINKQEVAKIKDAYERNTIKYAGEGIVFLGLILVGAAFIFRSLRRQVAMQNQQQNFMMAVTHEFKTPIAVAKLNLETLLKHELDREKQQKLIGAALDETKRLDFLANNILVSSQLESKGFLINKEELDFSYLLKDRVKEFKQRFTDRKIVTEIEENIDMKGDALLLQILVNNLLENAIKYTTKKDAIYIKLAEQPGKITLQIIDEGPGIAEEEQEKIFSKFYRIGNETTRKKQGTGLGLYICRKIAKDHNADISMTNDTHGGSIFAVQFYV